MFLFVENTIFNVKKIVTVEIDSDTPTELNYYISDGAFLKEKMKTDSEAESRLSSIEENNMFIGVGNNKLINLMYIKNVKPDVINDNMLVYTFYKGNDAIVKEKFKNEKELNDKIEEVKTRLDEINSSGGGSSEGGTVDLTPYLKKSVAEKTYAKITDIPDISGLASEAYVNGLVGDVEKLLGGI